MRSDILKTLQAAATQAQAATGETFTLAGRPYTFTVRQLTELEAETGGFEITEHGRHRRRHLLLIGTLSQFSGIDINSWPGRKMVREATGNTVTISAPDSTEDPLHLHLLAVERG